jgi:hypothetical protein
MFHILCIGDFIQTEIAATCKYGSAFAPWGARMKRRFPRHKTVLVMSTSEDDLE